jgi:NAD(P)-dependent dehydrogenase (short-subunit alcohol dehydrogenase family)
MQIKDHVFIVTGAASGLGAASAKRLIEQGAIVVLADMNPHGAAFAESLGANAHFVNCDVTSESDAIKVVETAKQLGGVHGLLNCAGIVLGEKTLGKDGVHALASFNKVIQINLIGTFNMIRIAAQAMSEGSSNEHGERGVIVNTASVAAYDGQIGQAAYSASKGGIVGMTLPIARDLARNGIRVCTIAPGIFETPMLMNMPDEVRESLGKQVPFPPRLGKPDEYAALAQHIIENVMLNGETIRLDGAIRMQPK